MPVETMEALSLEGEGWVRVADIEVRRAAFASLPLTNNEVRDAPGIPQPMPGAWATSLFLSPTGRGSAASINCK